MAFAIPLAMLAATAAQTGMAMSKGNKSGGTQQQSSGGSSLQMTDFDPRSGSEQQILNQLQGYGNQQLSFLNELARGTTSPFKLNAADQAQLDQSYQSAFDRFDLEGKDYADYLATTRGLNKSDTPVSQQAMQRYGMGMSDLLSQKANAGLQMGFQGAGMRLQGSQMLPAGLMGAFTPQFQERLAAPTTSTVQNGNVSGSSSFSPSPLTTLGQGLGTMGQGLQLGTGLGSMMGSSGGIGGQWGSMGMGSGAAANPTMGNYGSWSNGKW